MFSAVGGEKGKLHSRPVAACREDRKRVIRLFFAAIQRDDAKQGKRRASGIVSGTLIPDGAGKSGESDKATQKAVGAGELVASRGFWSGFGVFVLFEFRRLRC